MLTALLYLGVVAGAVVVFVGIGLTLIDPELAGLLFSAGAALGLLCAIVLLFTGRIFRSARRW